MNARIIKAAKAARAAANTYGAADTLFMLFHQDDYSTEPVRIQLPVPESVMQQVYAPEIGAMVGNAIQRWKIHKAGDEAEPVTLKDCQHFLKDAECGLVKGFGIKKIRRAKRDIIESVYSALDQYERQRFWETIILNNCDFMEE